MPQTRPAFGSSPRADKRFAGVRRLWGGVLVGNALRRRNRMRCCGLKGGTGQRVWGVLSMSQAEVGLAELALGMWPALVRPTEVDKSKSNDLNDPRRLLDVLPAAIYVTDAEGRRSGEHT